MLKKPQQSLSHKLIKLSLSLALAISFAISAIQLTFEYVTHKNEQSLLIQNILEVSEHTAIQAVVTLDTTLASNTIDGLLEYPFVTQAVIYGTAGNKLGEHQSSPANTPTRFITRLLGAEFSEYLIPLNARNSEIASGSGVLSITVDRDAMFQDFYEHAFTLFIGDFFGLLILSFILLFIFSRYVTQPLVAISEKIKRIEPRAPEQQHLTVDNAHENDELGQLATSFNAFIQAVDELIKEREKNETALLRSEELLLKTNKLAKVGGWDYDIKTGELLWSEELCDILGLNPDSRLDLNDIYNRINIQHKPNVEKAITQSIRTGKPFDISFGMVRADDKSIWVRAVGLATMHKGRSIWFSGIIQDKTEQQRSEQALMLRDFALNQTPDSILTVDSDGYIVVANDTTCERYGYRRKELIGQHIDIFNPESEESHWNQWWSEVKDNEHLVAQTHNITKDGTHFPAEISAGYFVYNDKEFCILSVTDITERKQQDEEIQHLAYHDMLTGLPNRSLLQDRLRLAINTAKRHQHIGALLFIDLDDFKKINDSLGHPAGDEVLKELAERLTSNLRDEDTVARLGGDEFVIILPYLSSFSDEASNRAYSFAEKLLEIISAPFNLLGHEMQINASIGMVLFPDGADNADTVLQFADTAMYQAKDSGHVNITEFSMEMTAKASRQLKLENQLRNALQNEEFFLHVQPQLNHDNQLIGAEILLRWDSPEFGLVSPAEFIPVLESTGLIFEVGQWVIQSACQQIKSWLDKDLWQDNMALAVNLSPRQFRRPQFVKEISEILLETQIPEHHLEIEITEGMVVHNIEDIVEKLNQLRKLGLKVSIDDFGMGYSSLSYLKRLPINTLKIDRSFIAGLPHDADDAAIVTAIIAMAKQLNLRVIAEGVEEKQQADFLQENECYNFQGFYFSKPMPLGEFEALLVEEKQR